MKSKTLISRIEKTLAEFIHGTEPTDLVDAILEDHRAMKDLIKILKSKDESNAKKQTAFDRFKTLLTSHSAAEETVVYGISIHMQETKLKSEEGYVEHDVAEDLLARVKSLKRTPNTRHWQAQLQVLGELVAHHLKEEEEDLLPKVRKKLNPKTSAVACRKFLNLRRKTQKKVVAENAGALRGAKAAR